MKNKKIKILHLIPSDGVGGVEVAAKTSNGIKNHKYTFALKFLSNQKNNSSLISKITSLLNLTISTYQVISSKPNILIVSLWKSCLSALIIKTFRPKTKIILFLHLSKSLNFIDYSLHLLISKVSNQVWADSYTTLKKRGEELKLNRNKRNKIISLVAYKLKPNDNSRFEPNFIFWGRLSHQKRIDLAINLFYEISQHIKNATFKIIGPDCGVFLNLLKLRNDLNLTNKIEFFSPMDIHEIKKEAKNCSFYLQLSSSEGLGMSVLESMQLGLIPVVTNVGEIKNYCIDNENSIIFQDVASTKDTIIKLTKNKKKMRTLRENAIETWANKQTYRENLIKSLDNLLVSQETD